MSLTTDPATQTTQPAPDPDRVASIKEMSRNHVFTSWSAQGGLDQLPLAGGEGAHFWDFEGNRYLDLTSQLVNVNIGYQHPKLVAAIQQAAGELATIAPGFDSQSRADAARMISERAPEGMSKVFFTNSGAEAVENAIRLARLHTGRHKLLAAYRSYHGATHGAISLTGEARRLGSEPSIPGVVHFWGPYLYRSSFHATTEQEESERALEHLRQTVQFEGPDRIAAIILESVVGSNGILVPPPGYLEGVRALCDEHGIMLIADEVMAGFARTGQWFAIQNWDVRPDLITFAKGVNSGYIPLGGVVISDEIAETFTERPYPGGLTYSGHALACASAVASMQIMEDEGILEHVRDLGERVIGPGLQALTEHSVVGDVRGLGMFWALELVSDKETREPLGAAEMAKIGRACKDAGVWPLIMANRIHVVPPCVITEDEAKQAIEVIGNALAGLT
ncbi:aspartate aminotransferase family protein [Ornithinimicrobium ciconiae]|uniref:Aspartate aminotransferase family protein n=1 Tax=Ornithinimicrobium ciconiae TaxID=2594265 RepID=A0A516G767_9MICO|nr:aspartate aminotransferase family protein [Ornithinimicrobium ciconiae]QDO87371.1 aspartate aminotransferase family protein [Ornithinimicrobium ciconiae]